MNGRPSFFAFTGRFPYFFYKAFSKKIVRIDKSGVVDSMSTFSSPQKSGSLARIRHLASSMANGKTYKRWSDVDAEMARLLRLHQSVWIAEAEDFHCDHLIVLLR